MEVFKPINLAEWYSSVEVVGQIMLKLNLIKGKALKWPILETSDHYTILACTDDLDEAGKTPRIRQ